MPTFRTQRLRHEIEHFATTLADHAHDDDIRSSETGHHPEQHALADTTACDQSDTLPATDGQQGVDGAYADIEHLVDGRALQRILPLAAQRDIDIGIDQSAAIQWQAESVDDPTQQLIADTDPRRMRHHPDAGAG